jgi:hypothetical protein
VWKLAGMAGDLCGLDWRAAMAALPRGLDDDFARRLLRAAEASYLAGTFELKEQQRGSEKGH